MDKMDKEVSKQMIGAIVALLVADKVPFRDAEALIDKYKSAPSRKRRKRTYPDVAFWEERYPGKGKAVMEMLQPFYGWKPVLKPAQPNLHERAIAAFSWTEVKGVRIIRRGDDNPYGELADIIGDTLMDMFMIDDSFEEEIQDKLFGAHWRKLEESLKDSFGGPLIVSSDIGYDDEFETVLFMATCSIVMGKPDDAAKFKPLLELWKDGNFPVGYDKEGNFLILVAD